ncbi:nucleoside triphosphate pyrophosphohydrolase family protein [Anaerosinus massiliensis]|uniref:nucleotide pyrophosphohydrolase n=1 Tax=Massilibacillus massiliensis TaxID=1806837 RepID=UPI000DA63CB9|nr:nucleotide pyrophosphohydrolase [Massilibacillus massiliensis]
MFEVIVLPKLNQLSPTLNSTLLKIIEEAGELARATLAFLPYQRLKGIEISELSAAKSVLAEVNAELLDVAQTCVTMIFVMEESYNIEIAKLIERHLSKLESKGYSFDKSHQYCLHTEGNYKYLALPKLDLPEVTLLTTVCKIQEELGELTQYLGKNMGASGEYSALTDREVMIGSAEELLDVAQCCFTMMYLLAQRYDVDVDELVKLHVAKLKRKGYCI